MFAEVFLVKDTGGVLFACKVSSNLQVWEREVYYMRNLKHPAFAIYYTSWCDCNKGYIIMEYVEGHTPQKKSLSQREGISIGIQLADILIFLYECAHPLVYRDLKPENILIQSGGRVRLVDVGVMCRAGINYDIAGSPGFGAPEQFRVGTALSAGTDIYGLGKTLLYLLKDTEKPLRELLKRCIERDSAGRISDVYFVKRYLETCLDPDKKISIYQKEVLRGNIELQKVIIV